MNVVFLKLYITDEVNNAFYNSQEIGLAKALVRIHPEHRVDIVMLSRSVDQRKDIDVCEGSSADNACDGKIKIHILPGKGIGHHGILDLSILKELHTDLVHLLADNMYFAPEVIDYCIKNNIKCHLYIGTLFTDSSSKIKKLVGNALSGRNLRAYRKVPVYAKTPFVREQLRQFGIDAVLAPVGLTPEGLITSEHDVHDIREHYGLPFEKKILLFVGRLEEYKRPLEALDLLEKLSGEADEEKYSLLIVGDGPLSGEIDSRIKSGSRKLSVRQIKRVPNSEMKELYKACDYFVNFNRVEIFGMAIMEAMVNGCPVFAMKAPGPDFLIDDGKTGQLCTSLDEMADKLRLIDENDNMRLEMMDAARKYVENELTWDKTVEIFKDWN